MCSAAAGTAACKHIFYGAAGWSGFETLATGLASAPSVASWAVGRLDVFWIGANGRLTHQWYGSLGWRGPESLGGALTGGVSAISWDVNRLDVFGEGVGGTLQHVFLSGLAGSFLVDADGWLPGRCS